MNVFEHNILGSEKSLSFSESKSILLVWLRADTLFPLERSLCNSNTAEAEAAAASTS